MSSKSINADVGILGQNQNNDHDSADEKSDVEDKDQGPAIASRLDVYNALENAKFIGSSSFAGKADGTKTIPALPPMSGLFIHDIGRISLPITPSQAKTLKANSWKTNDDVFTNIYQVEEHSIDIQNPLWDSSISKLIKTVAFKLGIRPDDLSAKLDMLLYMEKGSSIDWCSDVEEDDNIIGSMLIQLPSVFTGGKMYVFDGDEEVDEEDEANFITSFNLGGPNNEAEFACHFVCHYSDCQYEIEEITSGSRVLLRYSLCYSSSNDVVSPTANLLHKSVIPLKTSLSLLPRTDRMILVPLRKHYSPSSLILNGIDALAPDHRAIAESIKWAGGNNWTVLILNAHNTYTTRSERDENGQSKISLVTPYDEGGRKVDSKWIVKIIDFNPMEGEDDKKGGHMLLSTSKRLVDNWGKRKSRKTKEIYNGYDSESHYGYGYNDHISYEYISTYAATFVLAYDADSVYELKCVEVSKSSFSGRITRNDGVVAAAADVVKKQDYSLLGRLLDVVESKEELRFGSSTCRGLLGMVISTGNKCNGTTCLANRIIGALSTSVEPDSALWNTIVTAAKKFGWRDLRANVSSLLFDESRKKENDYGSSRKSRISLVVFLNRIDFCLTLTGADAYVRRSNFAQKCISDSIEDLAKTDNKNLLYRSLVEKIDSMVELHGWKAMANVAKHSLEFLLSNARWGLEGFVCIGRFVSKFHRKHSCSITLEAMKSFAMTFASKMAESSYFDLKNCLSSSPRVEALLACIRVVIEHGDQHAMGLVGKRLVSHRSTFSSFVKTASESAVDSIEPQTFLLDVLNKLLVQHSIDSEVACACEPGSSCDCKWNVGTPDNVGEDNITVSPSLHIKLALDASSNLAHMKDKDGRLPLHYAAARGVYETVACILEANPKAAVIRDPVSGLYPFMLAGSNENTAASFELLLSDPNLVLGGIPADEDDVENDRKRKRSPSM
eukprot:scaffold22545_cov107-Skeletonema_dohrnii-CCMP3373.AAC.1